MSYHPAALIGWLLQHCYHGKRWYPHVHIHDFRLFSTGHWLFDRLPLTILPLRTPCGRCGAVRNWTCRLVWSCSRLWTLRSEPSSWFRKSCAKSRLPTSVWRGQRSHTDIWYCYWFVTTCLTCPCLTCLICSKLKESEERSREMMEQMENLKKEVEESHSCSDKGETTWRPPGSRSNNICSVFRQDKRKAASLPQQLVQSGSSSRVHIEQDCFMAAVFWRLLTVDVFFPCFTCDSSVFSFFAAALNPSFSTVYSQKLNVFSPGLSKPELPPY